MKQEQLPLKTMHPLIKNTGTVILTTLCVLFLIGGVWMAFSQDANAALVTRADAVRDQMMYHIARAEEHKQLAAEEAYHLDQIKKQLPLSFCLEDAKNCPSDFILSENQ